MIRLFALLIALWAAPAFAWTSYNVHGMSYFYGMAVADFDKDGHVDLAYADSLAASRLIRPANAIVYLNNMHQGLREIYVEDFSWHPKNPSPSPHHLVERMVAVDINNDTWLDIVAVANSHDAVVAYLNPGASGAWTRQVLTTQTPGAVNLAIGDPDGDGDIDLFVTMRSQTESWPARKSGLGWLENDGNGGFTYRDIDVRSTVSLDEPRTLLSFDVFANGKDCASVGNLANGILSTYCLIPEGWSKANASGVVIGSYYSAAMDVVGSPLKEVIFARADGIYYAQTNWSVTHPIVGKLFKISLGSGEYVSEIYVSDVDGDGSEDIVFSLAYGGIYVAKKGPFGWSFSTISAQSLRYLNVAAMDWNDDGKIDILGGVEYPENMLQVFIQP